jgi:hypothetical protein
MAYKTTNTDRLLDDKGNMLSETVRERVLSKAPSDGLIFFVKLFSEDLGALYKVTKNSIVVFMEIASQVKFSDQNVYLTKIEKDKIIARTGIASSSIYNCLAELCKAGLLVRVVPSVYMVNPFLMATGSDMSIIENRKKFRVQLSAVYDVDEDGVCTDRTVQIESFKGKQ